MPKKNRRPSQKERNKTTTQETPGVKTSDKSVLDEPKAIDALSLAVPNEEEITFAKEHPVSASSLVLSMPGLVQGASSVRMSSSSSVQQSFSSITSSRYSAQSTSSTEGVRFSSSSRQSFMSEFNGSFSELDSPNKVAQACLQFSDTAQSSMDDSPFSAHSNSEVYSRAFMSVGKSFDGSGKQTVEGALAQIKKTPKKRKVSTDSSVMHVLNSGKFGGYKINEVIHETTVLNQKSESIMKEVVRKKDELRHVIVEEVKKPVVPLRESNEENRISIGEEDILDENEYMSILREYKSQGSGHLSPVSSAELPEDEKVSPEKSKEHEDPVVIECFPPPPVPKEETDFSNEEPKLVISVAKANINEMQSFKPRNLRPKLSSSSSSSVDSEDNENDPIYANQNSQPDQELLSKLSGYKVYSYPAVLSKDNIEAGMVGFSHFINGITTLSSDLQSGLKVAVFRYDTPELIPLESLSADVGFFVYEFGFSSVQAVLVSKDDLPVKCSIVPVTLCNSLYLATVVGGSKYFNRVLPKKARKCGYEKQVVLKHGVPHQLHILDMKERHVSGNLTLKDHSYYCLSQLKIGNIKDYVDIVIEDTNKAVVQTTLSLYNIGRINKEIVKYERKQENWELMNCENIPLDAPKKGRVSNMEPLFNLARTDQLSHAQMKSILLHLEIDQEFKDVDTLEALKQCLNTWKKQQDARASIGRLVSVLQLADVALHTVAEEILQNIANTNLGIYFAA